MRMGASFVSLHDRDRIESLLRLDTAINLYGIGDLDPFFWPHRLAELPKRNEGRTRSAPLAFAI